MSSTAHQIVLLRRLHRGDLLPPGTHHHRAGPRGIGRSVTKAVVNSLVVILILDYMLTRLPLP